MSWEGPDPVRDEDEPSLCAICSLAFHTIPAKAMTGCACLKYGCGCREMREQLRSAA